jgi:hypothetical protein
MNIQQLNTLSQSQSYVTTDGHPASLFWRQAPIWGLRPDFYYCQIVASLLMWSALSDDRTGLSFTIAAGPRQRSHSRDRVRGTRDHILCLRFETYSYDSQGYGGGIRPRLYRRYDRLQMNYVSFYDPVRTTNRTHT